jgi:hypothetical protein
MNETISKPEIFIYGFLIITWVYFIASDLIRSHDQENRHKENRILLERRNWIEEQKLKALQWSNDFKRDRALKNKGIPLNYTRDLKNVAEMLKEFDKK